MAEHSQAAMWLMLCTLVACFGMPAIGSAADLAELLNSGTVNASSPSPMDLSNVTTGTVPWDNSTSLAGGSNETNTTVLTGATSGAGMRTFLLAGHSAAVGLPEARKNLTEMQALITAAAQDVYTIEAVLSDLDQQALDVHNKYRARHVSTPSLEWDPSVADSARAYASRCIWGHDSSNSNQGENLYAYSDGSDHSQFLLDGLKAWYDEITLYNYNSPGFSEATGHFTQMVWKSSTRVGCAVQSCPRGLANWSQGRVYLVCRYSPPGNYIGQFQPNVMRVGSTPATAPAPQPPAPVTQTPAPVTQTPVPVTQTPAPVTQAPVPVNETPAPVNETPEPVNETPPPVLQTPVALPVFEVQPPPSPTYTTPPRPSPSPRPASPVLRPSPSPKLPVPSPSPAVVPQVIAPSPAAAASDVGSVLRQGVELKQSTCLASPNTIYRLCLDTTGRAQLLKTGVSEAVWRSPFAYSEFSGPFTLVVRSTGQMSIMPGPGPLIGFGSTLLTGLPLWNAPTFPNMGVAPYRLVVQDVGKVVLLDSRNVPIWKTGSSGF